MNIEGANYPKDQAARVDYVLKNTFTFEALLAKCAPLYPEMVVATASGPALTQAQLASNYDLVSRCTPTCGRATAPWPPAISRPARPCA